MGGEMPQPRVILAWGANKFGQCLAGENETTEVERKPRCVNQEVHRAIGVSTPVAAVAAGEAHTLLLTGYGDVFACGRGREGQLGVEPFCQDTRHLRLVEALRQWHVAQVACGHKHSLALTRCGRAFEWGMLLPLNRSDDDQANVGAMSGLGKDFNEDLNARQRRIVAESWNQYLRNPTNRQNSPGSDVEESHEEEEDANVISAMSEADCRRDVVRSPRACIGLEEVRSRSVSCGFAHTVVVAEGGSVFAAGYGEKGQLGKGSRCPCPRFEEVPLPDGVRAAFDHEGNALMSCGQNHTAVITSPGHELFTWGLGVFGQLGLGPNVKERHTPTKVTLPAAASQVACGDNHTVALTADGELFVFGHRDAVGRQNFHQRHPEKRDELSRDTGEEVERIFAGGNGNFALCSRQKQSDRFVSFQSFGYNQRFQLGRYVAELELKKAGPVALPPLLGATLNSFTAGPAHSVCVLNTPACCVLPPGVGEPCFGNEPLLSALNGQPVHDVTVITASGHVSDNLSAHYCVLRARCPALAARVKQVRSLEAFNPWELDLRGHTRRSVKALVEFLYTDHCRMGPDVASELKVLATDMKMERLLAGILMASETESVAAGMRWVRSADGKWEQIEANDENSLAVASSYSQDLEALVVEKPAWCPPPDYVEVVVRQEDGAEARTIFVARALLLTVDYFRALLEGGFAESTSMQSETPRAEMQVEDAAATALCLRMLATGNFAGLMPEQPSAVLALLGEAHRLQLREIVAAAEVALDCAIAAQKCSAEELKDIQRVAALLDLSRLAKVGSGDRAADCVVA